MRFVEDISGADTEQVRAWFATGMLLNVAAAMDLSSLGEEWPKRLLGEMLEKW